jgi:hypothetical protein
MDEWMISSCTIVAALAIETTDLDALAAVGLRFSQYDNRPRYWATPSKTVQEQFVPAVRPSIGLCWAQRIFKATFN